VSDAGAGVIVRKSASPNRIQAAVVDALRDPQLRAGAARMASALCRQDGAEAAVREILSLTAVQPAGQRSP
jgi:UDP:flavonoid glycosyltransferase YjiC (YdhE family)